MWKPSTGSPARNHPNRQQPPKNCLQLPQQVSAKFGIPFHNLDGTDLDVPTRHSLKQTLHSCTWPRVNTWNPQKLVFPTRPGLSWPVCNLLPCATLYFRTLGKEQRASFEDPKLGTFPSSALPPNIDLPGRLVACKFSESVELVGCHQNQVPARY